VEETQKIDARRGDVGDIGSFDYLKLIVWICAALGSWAVLIGVSHLAQAFMS
jgi:hypothetical protein